MIPHIVLIGVSPDLLYAWLPDCIELARQEQSISPLRPQAPRLAPAWLEPCHIPYYLRCQADWFVGIFARLPVEAPPLGEPLLLLCGRRIADDRTGIHIQRSDVFPLLLHEVAWSLGDRFLVDPTCPSSVPGYLRPPQAPPTADGKSAHRSPPPPQEPPPIAAGTDSAGLPFTVSEANGASPAFAASPPGAPVLLCNTWLEAGMRALPNPDCYDHLFAEWLRRYTELRGAPPADPRRSFKRAAERILQQIIQERLRRSLRKGPSDSDHKLT